jgi:hypothetical protein
VAPAVAVPVVVLVAVAPLAPVVPAAELREVALPEPVPAAINRKPKALSMRARNIRAHDKNVRPFYMKPNSGSVLGAAILAFFVLANAAYPHHATATEYDISKTTVLRGTISKVDWTNPHVHVRLNVKSKEGASEEWDIEFGSPGAMAVAGITKEMMQPGVVITVKGYPGRQPAGKQSDASATAPRRACATEATLPDGLTAKFVVGI